MPCVVGSVFAYPEVCEPGFQAGPVSLFACGEKASVPFEPFSYKIAYARMDRHFPVFSGSSLEPVLEIAFLQVDLHGLVSGDSEAAVNHNGQELARRVVTVFSRFFVIHGKRFAMLVSLGARGDDDMLGIIPVAEPPSAVVLVHLG